MPRTPQCHYGDLNNNLRCRIEKLRLPSIHVFSRNTPKKMLSLLSASLRTARIARNPFSQTTSQLTSLRSSRLCVPHVGVHARARRDKAKGIRITISQTTQVLSGIPSISSRSLAANGSRSKSEIHCAESEFLSWTSLL